MMKTAILAALVAALSAPPVESAQIMWRSPTAGVLEVTPARPSTPTPDPDEDQGGEQPTVGFGIFYGVTNVKKGTNLAIRPLTASGFPGDGFTYASTTTLPPGIVINSGTGVIGGRAVIPGTFEIPIRIARDDDSETVTAIIVVG
ncbi:putative Ig domain-containing protein [Sinorhizobium chiapasense]